MSVDQLRIGQGRVVAKALTAVPHLCPSISFASARAANPERRLFVPMKKCPSISFASARAAARLYEAADPDLRVSVDQLRIGQGRREQAEEAWHQFHACPSISFASARAAVCGPIVECDRDGCPSISFASARAA